MSHPEDPEDQPDVLATPHPVRSKRKPARARKHPMRQQPTPGPDDADGQDSDAENVDYFAETDPMIVAPPRPGARPVLRVADPAPPIGKGKLRGGRQLQPLPLGPGRPAPSRPSIILGVDDLP